MLTRTWSGGGTPVAAINGETSAKRSSRREPDTTCRKRSHANSMTLELKATIKQPVFSTQPSNKTFSPENLCSHQKNTDDDDDECRNLTAGKFFTVEK